MKDADAPQSADKKLLTALLLLAGLLIVSTVATLALESQGFWSAEEQAATTATAQPAVATASPATGVAGDDADAGARITPTIAVATPWGVLGLDGGGVADAGPSPEPVATALRAFGPVVLLGPPPGSQFRLGDGVTFYWDWPEQADDPVNFEVYLLLESGAVLMGTAEAENLGSIQQLTVRPGNFVSEPSNYQWQLVVVDEASGTALAESDRRPIVLLPDGNR